MQNVGTPRIYVNLHLWAKAMGLIHDESPYFTNSNVLSGEFWEGSWQGKLDDIRAIFENGANPVKAKTIYGVPEAHGAMSVITQYKTPLTQLMEGNCYLAFLNHNLASEGARLGQEIHFGFDAYTSETEDYSGTFVTTGGVNVEQTWQSNIFKAQYDGFSIVELTYSGETHNRIYPMFLGDASGVQLLGGEEIKMGGFAFGNYYDFPHSPDLNLTMSIENEGITTQQTKGGATLTNARYTGPPKWGDYEPFGLAEWSPTTEQLTSWSRNAQLGARTGRRVWNLTFSYLSDRDTLPVNALGGSLGDYESLLDSDNGYTYEEDWYGQGIFGSGADNYLSVLNGSDFYSAVWSKTMGGHLPFIFNPQGGNDNNPSNFAICRFDMKSLQVKQTAPSLYSISLKIRECW